MAKTSSGKTERLVFDWQRGASERSKAAWEKRWERAFDLGMRVGPKGEKYLEKKYGVEVGGGGGKGGGGIVGGGGGRRRMKDSRGRYWWSDEWPDYDDYDFYDSEDVSPRGG